MPWLPFLSWFFGGALLANAVPHVVNGLTGCAFQSPFAKPPGEGLSSSTTNVCWGYLNLALGYLLLAHVGHFDVQSIPCVGTAFAGALLLSVLMARHFGRFHGGNAPERR
ncbi:hypothetical protein IHE49_16530 [Rhodanobacter sp. 7MK24]|uniref:hypothetical protein n=1 Tax=Rhodanobacter sp. 7MK24 TaxID=2775922 RepID=UPI00177C37EB|nr:hypothetical protein [Rhodanobacter sp. 7MK24]MBD8882091.1 hypothetical protein [Rhodanobacter sp. 7MK24]